MPRSLLVLFAFFILSFTSPALADWENAGRIAISGDYTQRVLGVSSRTPVDRIRFTAGNRSVVCNRVVAGFRNGEQAVVFSGRLESGRTRGVHLAQPRYLRSLSFFCRGARGNNASVQVALRTDSRYNRGRRDDYDDRDWLAPGFDRVGAVSFTRRPEREVEVTEFKGPVDIIRLTARRGGAVCERVDAVFGNGNRRPVFSGRIREGAYQDIVLRNERNVRKLIFFCRADRVSERTRLLVSGRYSGPSVFVDPQNQGNFQVFGPGGGAASAATFGRSYARRFINLDYSGRVRGLLLGARGGALRCDRVTALLANGSQRTLFAGFLREREIRTITFNQPRNIRGVIATCRSGRNDRRADLVVGAVSGRGAQAATPDRFTRVGSVRFGETFTRRVLNPASYGRIGTLRFRAAGGNVRCDRIIAVFRNGARRELFSGRIASGETRVNRFDNPRNIRELIIVCRAGRSGDATARLVVSAR